MPAELTQNVEQTNESWWGWIKTRWTNVATFVVVVLILDLCLDPVCRPILRYFQQSLSITYSYFLWSSITGFVLGQGVLIALLAGLYGTSWIDGFLAGCVAFLLGAIAIKLGSPETVGIHREFWKSAWITPGLVFAASSPLLLMRHLKQWRLIRPPQDHVTLPSSIGSQFTSMTVIACIVVSLRAPQVLWRSSPAPYFAISAIVGLVVFLIAAAATLPTSLILNVEGRAKQLTRLVIVATVTSLVFAAVLLAIAEWNQAPAPGQFFLQMALTVVVATATLYVGIRALCRDGFRLHIQPRAHGEVAPAQTVLQRHRRRAHLQTALIVLSVIALNVYLSRFQARDLAFGRIITGLTELANSEGGEVNGYVEHQSLSVKLPNATDAQIRSALKKLTDIKQGCQELNLAHSQVSDDCLTEIGQARNLYHLDLSSTTVSGRQFSSLSKLGFHTLHLNNLNLQEADWMSIPTARLFNLGLRGTQLSPNDFARFLSESDLAKLRHLDLSEVKVNDAVMNALGELARDHGRAINLSGTEVNDAQIRRLEKSSFSKLNLSRTKVTDGGLASMPKMNTLSRLDLGETVVTDAGIATLRKLELSEFSLSGTKCTGIGFATWATIPYSLDLSNTPAGDEFVKMLASQRKPTDHMGTLNLANTKITDVIVNELATTSCDKLVITGTELSAAALAKALAKSKPSRVHQLEVGRGQFTGAELKSLEKSVFEVVFSKQKDSQ